MPALCAKQYNEHLQHFVNRLKANGLAPKQIVGAMMRKLAGIIFGMIKNDKEFDPKLI